MNDELKGMTVNERLWHLRLFNDYEEAERAKNEEKLREILTRCEIGNENVSAIITKIINTEPQR